MQTRSSLRRAQLADSSKPAVSETLQLPQKSPTNKSKAKNKKAGAESDALIAPKQLQPPLQLLPNSKQRSTKLGQSQALPIRSSPPTTPVLPTTPPLTPTPPISPILQMPQTVAPIPSASSRVVPLPSRTQSLPPPPPPLPRAKIYPASVKTPPTRASMTLRSSSSGKPRKVWTSNIEEVRAFEEEQAKEAAKKGHGRRGKRGKMEDDAFPTYFTTHEYEYEETDEADREESEDDAEIQLNRSGFTKKRRGPFPRRQSLDTSALLYFTQEDSGRMVSSGSPSPSPSPVLKENRKSKKRKVDNDPKSENEGAEALLGLSGSFFNTTGRSTSNKTKRSKSYDANAVIDTDNFFNGKHKRTIPPPPFPHVDTSFSLRRRLQNNAAHQLYSRCVGGKRNSMHVSAAYYIHYKQQYDVLEKLSPSNREYAQKYLFALSLDPTSSAKMLRERSALYNSSFSAYHPPPPPSSPSIVTPEPCPPITLAPVTISDGDDLMIPKSLASGPLPTISIATASETPVLSQVSTNTKPRLIGVDLASYLTQQLKAHILAANRESAELTEEVSNITPQQVMMSPYGYLVHPPPAHAQQQQYTTTKTSATTTSTTVISKLQPQDEHITTALQKQITANRQNKLTTILQQQDDTRQTNYAHSPTDLQIRENYIAALLSTESSPLFSSTTKPLEQQDNNASHNNHNTNNASHYNSNNNKHNQNNNSHNLNNNNVNNDDDHNNDRNYNHNHKDDDHNHNHNNHNNNNNNNNYYNVYNIYNNNYFNSSNNDKTTTTKPNSNITEQNTAHHNNNEPPTNDNHYNTKTQNHNNSDTNNTNGGNEHNNTIYDKNDSNEQNKQRHNNEHNNEHNGHNSTEHHNNEDNARHTPPDGDRNDGDYTSGAYDNIGLIISTIKCEAENEYNNYYTGNEQNNNWQKSNSEQNNEHNENYTNEQQEGELKAKRKRRKIKKSTIQKRRV